MNSAAAAGCEAQVWYGFTSAFRYLCTHTHPWARVLVLPVAPEEVPPLHATTAPCRSGCCLSCRGKHRVGAKPEVGVTTATGAWANRHAQPPAPPRARAGDLVRLQDPHERTAALFIAAVTSQSGLSRPRSRSLAWPRCRHLRLSRAPALSLGSCSVPHSATAPTFRLRGLDLWRCLGNWGQQAVVRSVCLLMLSHAASGWLKICSRRGIRGSCQEELCVSNGTEKVTHEITITRGKIN